MTHSQEKIANKIHPNVIQILELSENNFKAVILNMFEDLKENMLWREPQNKNGNYKKKQIKSIMYEIKHSFIGFKSRM